MQSPTVKLRKSKFLFASASRSLSVRGAALKTTRMSHFSTIKTQIKDINDLCAACAELGLGLVQNSSARGYINQQTKGEYVIKLNGPYDIALNKNDDGTYGLTTDWWGGARREGCRRQLW